MTRDHVEIRLATPNDAQAIATVQVASWRTTYPGIVAQSYIDGLSIPERASAWERRLSADASVRPDVFLAESPSLEARGFISGGAIREPEAGFDAELHAIYLLEAAQGKGIGRRLARAWAAVATDRGFQSAIVRVLALNPARHFYERLGAEWVKDSQLEIAGVSYPEVWYGWRICGRSSADGVTVRPNGAFSSSYE